MLQRENGDIDLRDADGTRVIRSVQAGTPWNYGNIAVGRGPAAGQILVAGERADGRGIITDLGSGRLLGVFPIGKASPYQQTTMAFTPGGRSLVTVTEGNSRTDDGLLTQLSLTPAQWVRVACTTSGHGLTPGDWRRYISPSPPVTLRVCPMTRQLPESQPQRAGGPAGPGPASPGPAGPGTGQQCRGGRWLAAGGGGAAAVLPAHRGDRAPPSSPTPAALVPAVQAAIGGVIERFLGPGAKS